MQLMIQKCQQEVFAVRNSADMSDCKVRDIVSNAESTLSSQLRRMRDMEKEWKGILENELFDVLAPLLSELE